MRQIALILALTMGLVMLSGCRGWNWRDPLHPQVTHNTCPCPPRDAPGYDPCRCGTIGAYEAWSAPGY